MPVVRKQRATRLHEASQSPATKAAVAMEMMRHYRNTFGTESGRIVLADLLRRCKVLAPRDGPAEEGAAGVGYHIIEMITRDEANVRDFVMTSEVGDLLR